MGAWKFKEYRNASGGNTVDLSKIKGMRYPKLTKTSTIWDMSMHCRLLVVYYDEDKIPIELRKTPEINSPLWNSSRHETPEDLVAALNSLRLSYQLVAKVALSYIYNYTSKTFSHSYWLIWAEEISSVDSLADASDSLSAQTEETSLWYYDSVEVTDGAKHTAADQLAAYLRDKYAQYNPYCIRLCVSAAKDLGKNGSPPNVTYTFHTLFYKDKTMPQLDFNQKFPNSDGNQVDIGLETITDGFPTKTADTSKLLQSFNSELNPFEQFTKAFVFQSYDPQRQPQMMSGQIALVNWKFTS